MRADQCRNTDRTHDDALSSGWLPHASGSSLTRLRRKIFRFTPQGILDSRAQRVFCGGILHDLVICFVAWHTLRNGLCAQLFPGEVDKVNVAAKRSGDLCDGFTKAHQARPSEIVGLPLMARLRESCGDDVSNIACGDERGTLHAPST